MEITATPRKVVTNTAVAFALGLLAAAPACSREWPEARTDYTKRSPGLILLPGAQEIVYYDTLDREGRTALEQISYKLDEPFPAAGVVCEIVKQLIAAGWRPIDASNVPDGPGSFLKGWGGTSSKDKTGVPVRVDQWLAGWVNGTGELLSYALTYRYPQAQPDNRGRLQVGAGRTPADAATPEERTFRKNAKTVAVEQPARVSADVTCQK